MTTSISRTSLSILLSQAAAVLVMLVGGSVLIGWLLNVPVLKSVAPDLVSMKVNTALCLLALGIALLLQGKSFSQHTRSKFGIFLAAIAAAISSFTLLEYIAHHDFGIDQLLFIDDTSATATDSPGRMAPVTAISLVLCSVALLLEQHARLSRHLALAVLFLAALATTGYLFEARPLYHVIGYTSIAVHTAVALMTLSLGILASRPQEELVAIILSDTAGGEMARRMLWMMPLLLFLLNWLVFQGEHAKWYDSRFGLAISSVGSIAVSWVLIMVVARRLHSTDKQRQQALDQLASLNNRLERTVLERTQELTFTNQKLEKEITERKQAEEQIRRLSLTDELSGLLNRRGFLLLAEQALKTARRAQTELTLTYIDLDGLKLINDTMGHQAGDAMIIDTAQLLKANFRESDLIARLGGDEFTVLAVSGESSETMLARLHQAIRQFNQGNVLTHPLSFSMGTVKCLPQDDKSLLELLAEADALMYQQKQERGGKPSAN